VNLISNRQAVLAAAIIVFVIAFPLFRWHQHADHITALQQQNADAAALVDTYQSNIDAIAAGNAGLEQGEAAILQSMKASEDENVVSSAGDLGMAIQSASSRRSALSDAMSTAQQALPGDEIAAEKSAFDRYAQDATAADKAFSAAAATATGMAQDPFLTLGARDKGERDIAASLGPPVRHAYSDAQQIVADLRGAQQKAASARDAVHDALAGETSASVLAVIISP
jgi:cell division protein FtsB